MSYTSVFGGTTIFPSDVSYLPLTLGADKALEWPMESNDPANPAASIIDVTTTGAFSLTLPDATQTGAGQTILFNNLSASSNSFLLKDAGGGTIATVGVGEQWQVYLSGTATPAGVWRVFRYGASTATVQASALVGYGLTVTDSTLSQSLPVTTFNTAPPEAPRQVLLEDRASALVWTGTGAGVLNLPSAASAGNNFFIGVRNSGGGDLTVDASGSEQIDGGATLTLRPGDSANILTNGLEWYTLGLGQEAVFAFDYTSVSVTGGTYTLAGSELNRIAYKFVGVLTADQYIVVPATVQQYWADNATTGAFNLYLQTSGGTPVAVTQGGRGIYYCNGSNVVDADTSTVSLPVSATDGGTGQTSYTIGDTLYANTPSTLAKLSSVASGNALLAGGVGVAPVWGKIGLTTHVSGTLPVANGGTGATDAATARINLGLSDVVYTTGAQTIGGVKTFSSTVSLADGGFVFASDGALDTGMRWISDGVMAARTDGVDRLTISNTDISVPAAVNFNALGPATFGAIITTGSGVTTGDARLELGLSRTGNGNTYIDISASPSGDYDTRLLRAAGANGDFNITNKGTGSAAFGTEGAGSTVLTTNNAGRVFVTPAGRVGVGVSTPTFELEASGIVASYRPGGAQAGFWLYNGGLSTEWFTGQRSSTDHSYKISSVVAGSYADRVTITPSGEVGIGLANPSQKLHVQGNVQVTPPAGWSAGQTSVVYLGDSNNYISATNGGGATVQGFGGVSLAAQGIELLNLNTFGGVLSPNLADAVGYKGLPQNQRTSAYTLALSDIGKHLYTTAGAFAVTVPSNATTAFQVGTAITVINEDAVKTIAPAAGVTLVQAGTGATGTRTLAIGAIATLIKVQSDRWYISGAGIT